MLAFDSKQLTVTPLGSAVGAQIDKLDINRCSEAQLQALKRALATFGVLVLPEQQLQPQQQVDFAQRLGEININRFFKASDEHPLIAEVRKEAHQKANIGSSWHTDHSYDQQPALGSILYAKELPPAGGDTLFQSMHAAWASLSDGLKHVVAGLRAKHSSRHVFGQSKPEFDGRLLNPEQATQDAVHPMVIKHPESGQSILYVNPQFTVGIEGWHKSESDALLQYLYQQALQPEYGCRVRWQKNTLVIWDNRSTWHRALNDYPGHARLMHRITLEGGPLQAAG